LSAPETVIVHTDGASRGNPGPASIGVVIAEPSGHVLREFGEALAPTTNNVAEYTAVIRALESALELGARRVQVQMDSQLVVRQLNGSYRVKHPDMLPLYRRVLELIQRFEEVTFAHVPREQNTEADRLANAALDRVPAEESAVARLFKLLVDGKAEEARGLLSTEFEYRRASDEDAGDAEVFLRAWRRPGAGWQPASIRVTGPDIIFEARRQKEAILWIGRVGDGKVESITEYRDVSTARLRRQPGFPPPER